MGRTASGRGTPHKKKVTQSGYTLKSFQHMTDEEKKSAIDEILNSTSISIPDYMDNSATSKLMVAIGMDAKPKVVSDDKFDSVAGSDMTLYRTVNGNDNITADEIFDQIMHGDYTQMPKDSSSMYGRGLYFATVIDHAGRYGWGDDNKMMRSKLTNNANIADYNTLSKKATSFFGKNSSVPDPDQVALYAITHGYDGWTNNDTYIAIVNRGKLICSSTTKKASAPIPGTYRIAPRKSWNEVMD